MQALGHPPFLRRHDPQAPRCKHETVRDQSNYQGRRRVFRSAGIHAAPFAGWSPADWERRLDASSQIVELGMGWDVTDFGSGRYRERGLLLFTLRNGTADELAPG